MRKSKWLKLKHFESIRGAECEITLTSRPSYCDRGNWLAQLFPSGELAMEVDSQDAWPRYYMDLDRAKLEIQDWMKKRGQWLTG